MKSLHLRNKNHIHVPLGELRISDGEQLLCNDRKYFDIDSVEFIKTAPCSGLCKTREKLAHHLVVESFGTVEDDALFGKS